MHQEKDSPVESSPMFPRRAISVGGGIFGEGMFNVSGFPSPSSISNYVTIGGGRRRVHQRITKLKISISLILRSFLLLENTT